MGREHSAIMNGKLIFLEKYALPYRFQMLYFAISVNKAHNKYFSPLRCWPASVQKCLNTQWELIVYKRACVSVCSHMPSVSTISLTWLAVAVCAIARLMKDKKLDLSLLHWRYKHSSLHNNGAVKLAFIRGIRSLI